MLASSELAPGTHTLDVVETDTAGTVTFADGIVFVVDPAGTGACV